MALIQYKGNNSSIITVPSSKSLTHRSFIVAGLSNGESNVDGVNFNDDVNRTKQCLEALGVIFGGNTIKGPISFKEDIELYCGSSGSTLRFLIPIVALSDKKVTFVMDEQLSQRPLSVYEDIFKKQNLLFNKQANKLEVCGPLKPGDYTVQADISSQFISGLLFALPLLDDDSTIYIDGKLESKPYVDLTIDMLNKAGIDIQEDGTKYIVKGNQEYHGINYHVESDMSLASNFAVLAAITNQQITINNIPQNSTQADYKIFEYLKKFGASVEFEGNSCVIKKDKLIASTIDLSDCPDLGPILFVLATQCEGKTTFTNTRRLRYKESDRILSMKQELSKLGYELHDDENSITIKGGKPVVDEVIFNCHDDHRIAMALTILASIIDKEVELVGSECVSKSYPKFFEEIITLGYQVKYSL